MHIAPAPLATTNYAHTESFTVFEKPRNSIWVLGSSNSVVPYNRLSLCLRISARLWLNPGYIKDGGSASFRECNGECGTLSGQKWYTWLGKSICERLSGTYRSVLPYWDCVDSHNNTTPDYTDKFAIGWNWTDRQVCAHWASVFPLLFSSFFFPCQS